jgi:hypothetical protein
MERFADYVFVNGELVTVDAAGRIAEALAVGGERILAVGANEHVRPWVGPNTTVVDLGGRTVLPGLIDAHAHLVLYGTCRLSVDCKAPYIRSLDDLLRELARAAAATPKGRWIRAFGFNETKIAERRFPHRRELDAVTTDHPVYVERACGHVGAVNSRGLMLAGIDRDTADPQGGVIERDADGEPTGKLIETALTYLDGKMDFSRDEVMRGLGIASAEFAANGITSVHDAGADSPEQFRWLFEAVEAGIVKQRIYAMVATMNHSDRFVDRMVAAGIRTGMGDHRFRIGPAKVFVDGSSSAPTLATREPYMSDPGNSGLLYYTQEQLNRVLGDAHAAGFQITAHAQGDRAIGMLLDCIEAALAEHPRADHRHRIEHAGLTAPDLLPRMQRLGVIPVANPAFFHEYGDGYVVNLGERAEHMYPLRSFVEYGIPAAAGSDCPVTVCNPFLGMFQAMHRLSETGRTIGEAQRIGLMDAIRLFTIHAARASFEETVKGSLEPGKLADVVVLDRSLLTAPAAEIRDVRVEATMIGGTFVYGRP